MSYASGREREKQLLLASYRQTPSIIMKSNFFLILSHCQKYFMLSLSARGATYMQNQGPPNGRQKHKYNISRSSDISPRQPLGPHPPNPTKLWCNEKEITGTPKHITFYYTPCISHLWFGLCAAGGTEVWGCRIEIMFISYSFFLTNSDVGRNIIAVWNVFTGNVFFRGRIATTHSPAE